MIARQVLRRPVARLIRRARSRRTWSSTGCGPTLGVDFRA